MLIRVCERPRACDSVDGQGKKGRELLCSGSQSSSQAEAAGRCLHLPPFLPTFLHRNNVAIVSTNPNTAFPTDIIFGHLKFLRDATITEETLSGEKTPETQRHKQLCHPEHTVLHSTFRGWPWRARHPSSSGECKLGLFKPTGSNPQTGATGPDAS